MRVPDLTVAFVVLMFGLMLVKVNSFGANRGGIYTERDLFTIPESLCHRTPFPCTLYGGMKLLGIHCQCVCPPQRPTFGFYNGRFECLDTTILRTVKGTVKGMKVKVNRCLYIKGNVLYRLQLRSLSTRP